jgi:predicted nucleotidyltransferase
MNSGSFDRGVRMPILTEEQVLSFIKTHKDDFHERYGVHRIGLFGSFARKEQTESSDVDIAIEMEPEKKNIHNFLAFKRHLEKELGRKVDLGIESALKLEARKFIEKEIVYV